jgi:hypothetical protein
MQSLPLACHPDTPCPALASVAVAVRRPRGEACLELEYALAGNIAALKVPAPAAPRRVAGLWQHTCLEAFVGIEDSPAYLEVNFSPSGEWAAWTFDGHRAGMREADLPAPRIETRRGPGLLVLRAELDLSGQPWLTAATTWQAGFTAGIERLDGSLSYWALAHPPGKPDFHASAGRCVRLQGKLGA